MPRHFSFLKAMFLKENDNITTIGQLFKAKIRHIMLFLQVLSFRESNVT